MSENQLSVRAAEMPSVLTSFGNKDAFEHAQRVAKMISASDLVPMRFKNNVQNTMIALEFANRLNASPIMVMQNLYIVHGSPGWSGQFVISAINSCGKFADDLDFEFTGKEDTDEWSCRAFTKDKKGREKRGAKVSIKMAKSEGWYDKSGSKWKTMAEQMLMYRAASFFGRVHCPDVLNGMYTVDEINDYTEMAEFEMDKYILKLLDNANMDEEEKAIISDKVAYGLTSEEANIIASELRNNQLDPLTHGKNFSATDAKEHLKRITK